MNSFERKLIELSKEKFAAQTRLSEAQAELDRREWERRIADISSVKLADSLIPSGWNSTRQINCLIRVEG